MTHDVRAFDIPAAPLDENFEQIGSRLLSNLERGITPCPIAENTIDDAESIEGEHNRRYEPRRSPDQRGDDAGSRKPRRKKRGRPKKAWHLRRSYQRRRNAKRLRRWQVEELIEANKFAAKIGLSLRTFGTIRWAKTDGGERDIAGRMTALWKCARAWAKRLGDGLAYVYTHENPDRPGGGFNSHFLVSVPPSQRPEFETIVARQVGASGGGVVIEPRCQPRRRDTRLNYMLKGTDKATAVMHRLIEPQKGWDYAQGEIQHKRAGTSTNIGRTARAAVSDGRFDPNEPAKLKTGRVRG